MMQQDDDEIALKVIIRRSDLAALKMIAEHEGASVKATVRKGDQKKDLGGRGPSPCQDGKAGRLRGALARR